MFWNDGEVHLRISKKFYHKTKKQSLNYNNSGSALFDFIGRSSPMARARRRRIRRLSFSLSSGAPRFRLRGRRSICRFALVSARRLRGRSAAAAQAQDPSMACRSRCAFVCRDGLLYRRGRRGDRLCIPAAGALRAQVLNELHATPLGGHFGRDKTLALAQTTYRRPVCCYPCRSPRAAAGVSAWTSSSCPSPAPATTFCRCTSTS